MIKPVTHIISTGRRLRGQVNGGLALDRLGSDLRAALAQSSGMLPFDVPRHALVIGNGAYTRVPALHNPTNDARLPMMPARSPAACTSSVSELIMPARIRWKARRAPLPPSRGEPSVQRRTQLKPEGTSSRNT
jgi:hypothetical protein